MTKTITPPATLVLSEMAGSLGLTVDATASETDLQDLILSQIPKPLAGVTLSTTRENRQLKIDNLCLSENFSPVVKNLLQATFASEDVDLVLSEDGSSSDGFETVMKVLSSLPKSGLHLSEKTNRQTLSNPVDNGDSTGKSMADQATEMQPV